MFYSQLLIDGNLNWASNAEMKQLWEKCRDAEPKDVQWHNQLRDLVVAITHRLKNESLFEWNEVTQDYDDRFTYKPSDTVWQQFNARTYSLSNIWTTAGVTSAAKNRFLSFASAQQSTEYCGDCIYVDAPAQKIYIGMLCCDSKVGYKIVDYNTQNAKLPVIDETILCFDTYCQASSYDRRVTDDFWPKTLQILSEAEPSVTDTYWWQLDLIGNHLFNDKALNLVTLQALQYHVARDNS